MMKQKKSRKRKRQKIIRVLFATLYLFILTLVGFGSNGTYAYFATLARSQVGEAASADSSDILKVEGTFDQDKWPGVGSSGFKITNRSHASVWVYFDVTGSLRDVVKHIEPFRLNAGEVYEIPLVIADAGDMGMLQWRNQAKTFSGEIIARVLNNYASYRVGKVELSGDKLYDKLVGLQVKPGDEISGIKGVSDINGLIAEKNRLNNEVAQLKEEKLQLQMANISLQNEIDSLYKTIAALVNRKTSTPAPAQTPPQQESSAPTPAQSESASAASPTSATAATNAVPAALAPTQPASTPAPASASAAVPAAPAPTAPAPAAATTTVPATTVPSSTPASAPVAQTPAQAAPSQATATTVPAAAPAAAGK